MFPMIPFLALVSLVGGGVSLSWYGTLSQQAKNAANGLAGEYAKSLFGKVVKELSRGEAKEVLSLIKNRFTN